MTGRSPMFDMRGLLGVLAIAAALPAFAADDVDGSNASSEQHKATAGSGISVVTPKESAPSGGRSVGGPGVELITGGNSKDGAARVGRLPVLD